MAKVCGECRRWMGEYDAIIWQFRQWALCDRDISVSVAGCMSVYSEQTPACLGFEPREEESDV